MKWPRTPPPRRARATRWRLQLQADTPLVPVVTSASASGTRRGSAAPVADLSRAGPQRWCHLYAHPDDGPYCDDGSFADPVTSIVC